MTHHRHRRCLRRQHDRQHRHHNGRVKSVDIGNHEVRGIDVRNDTLTGGGLTTDDIYSLTGADIGNESTSYGLRLPAWGRRSVGHELRHSRLSDYEFFWTDEAFNPANDGHYVAYVVNRRRRRTGFPDGRRPHPLRDDSDQLKAGRRRAGHARPVYGKP